MSLEADLACGVGMALGLVAGMVVGVVAARAALRSRIRAVDSREVVLEHYAAMLGRTLRRRGPALTQKDWQDLIDENKPVYATRAEILRKLLENEAR